MHAPAIIQCHTLILFWIFLFVCPGVMDMRSKVFAGGRFTTLTALKLLSGDIITVSVHQGNGKFRDIKSAG
jgi:hypothetical protein